IPRRRELVRVRACGADPLDLRPRPGERRRQLAARHASGRRAGAAPKPRLLLVLLRDERPAAPAESRLRGGAETSAHRTPLPRLPRWSQLGALAGAGEAVAARARDEARRCLG